MGYILGMGKRGPQPDTEARQRILGWLTMHPTATDAEAGRALTVARQYVRKVRLAYGIAARPVIRQRRATQREQVAAHG